MLSWSFSIRTINMKQTKGFRKLSNKVKTAKGRKNSSTHWLQRHINDQYVILAKQQNYRSRAAFKLLEMVGRFNLLENTQKIVDLGCAPGGWLQVLKQQSNAQIIGIELQCIEPIEGIDFIQGDFLDEKVYCTLTEQCGKVDLILSDMADKACGIPNVDHLRIINLVEAALEFATHYLNLNGNLVVKMLRGGQEHALIKQLKQQFSTVKMYKPDASYKDSSEIYLICLQYKG